VRLNRLITRGDDLEEINRRTISDMSNYNGINIEDEFDEVINN
jgi:hypothetical protein